MTLGEFISEIGTYSKEEYFEHFGETEQILNNLELSLQQMEEGERKALLKELEEESRDFPAWMQIHMLSFCALAGGRHETLEQLLDVVIQTDYEILGEYNKLNYYWQISTSIFSDMRLQSDLAEERLAQLYKTLYEAFARALGLTQRHYIPVEQRDKHLVLVMTSQVLSEKHAPTKTLLDRCYVLQKYFDKKVWIVNTAMQLTSKGAAPFYRQCEAGYLPELCECRTLSFREERFEFYQCADDMPDLDTIVSLVQMIRERKPYYLLNIGGSDICADICGMFVPEITISTVFSKVATSCGEYQIVDKALTGQDHRLLQILGVSSKKVKHAGFTFTFKEKGHSYTRERLGLGKDSFVLLIVGWRLDSEITGEFLEVLQRAVQQEGRIQAAFMGRFEQYEERLADYPILRQHACNLGKQEDALAVTECCDLYVNPKRTGGGSSVSEALYEGLPAVTLPNGDVSVAAGEQFWVEDYEAMEHKILRYARDESYYKEMSGYAKERAEYLLDSRGSFGAVMAELEQELTLKSAF